VPHHRVEALLGLARQGLEIAVEFGGHSLEAMTWVARTVETSVYEPGSLTLTPTGVRFTLSNPPLRTGAFATCRVGIDGASPRAEGVRVRPARSTIDWRLVSGVTDLAPLELRPGEPIEFDVTLAARASDRPITVRLELECRAIPPLVWFEFTDTPRTPGAAP